MLAKNLDLDPTCWNSSILTFIHSVNSYFATCYAPGSVLGTGDIYLGTNQTKSLPTWSLQSLGCRQTIDSKHNKEGNYIVYEKVNVKNVSASGRLSLRARLSLATLYVFPT